MFARYKAYLINRFQFHKGTIRTCSNTINDDKLLVFQFHKGTIRTGGDAVLWRRYCNFNSIKVRLERVNPWL